MKKSLIILLAVLFGLIIITLPFFGFITGQAITGLSMLLISIFLLVLGTATIEQHKWASVLYIIIGFIILLISIGIIFSLSIFIVITPYILYLSGIFLIIIGVVSIAHNRMNKYGFIRGIISILIGVIYLILGFIIKNPLVLGCLIGIWLIIIGIIRVLDK